MGPGPINADPRVLRAMSAQLLGQFDPQFRHYMKEVSELYRGVFQTANRWTLLIDGTARAAIEAVLASLIEPGDRVLVPIFGRFGHLKVEIAQRYGAEVIPVEVEWGTVFPRKRSRRRSRSTTPRSLPSRTATPRPPWRSRSRSSAPCAGRRMSLLYVDATATLGGMELPVDAWQLDAVSAGLQKCLAGPSGSAPLTLNERAEKVIVRRRHTEAGLRAPGSVDGEGPTIRTNYFDLAMVMDYWSDKALNHHTEATSMLYAARECARILLQEGLEKAFHRHALASRALTEGLKAMGLKLFGDQRHKMANVTGVHIPQGVDGDRARSALLKDFNIEIGTSFGPLHGRIWRIGTMGYNARPDAVLQTLAALDAVLNQERFKLPRGAGVDAALAVYRKA